MSLIERMARAIYETQDNPVPWDSETLGDWRRDYEREKARAALAVVRDHDRGAVEDRDRWRDCARKLYAKWQAGEKPPSESALGRNGFPMREPKRGQ